MKIHEDHNRKTGSGTNKILQIIKFGVLLLIIIGIPVYLWFFHRDLITDFNSAEELKNLILQNRETSVLVYLLLQIIQIVICFIPGEFVQLAGGYLFAPFTAFLLIILGVIAGSAVCFGLSRVLGQGFIRIFVPSDKIDYYADKLNSKRAYLLCFLLFLIPGIPKDLLNYIAGITDMKFVKFLAISTVARIPGIIGTLAIGHFLEGNMFIEAIIVFLIASIIILICFIKRNEIEGFINKLQQNNSKREDE